MRYSWSVLRFFKGPDFGASLLTAVLAAFAASSTLASSELLLLVGSDAGTLSGESWFGVASLDERGRAIAASYALVAGLTPAVVGATMVGQLVDTGRINYVLAGTTGPDRARQGCRTLSIILARYFLSLVLLIVALWVGALFERDSSPEGIGIFSTVPISSTTLGDLIRVVLYLGFGALPYVLIAAIVALRWGGVLGLGTSLAAFSTFELALVLDSTQGLARDLTPAGPVSRWWIVINPQESLGNNWAVSMLAWSATLSIVLVLQFVRRPQWVGRVL